MLEKYTAGENIASICTKCKLNLDHAIVAMDGDTIAKVKCKTCGSTHKFKNPATPPKTVKRRTKKADGQGSASLWEAGISSARGKEHTYSMGGRYRVGDIVNHDSFGKGVVQKLYTNKCDVLFQDKTRFMASAN